MNKDNKSEFDIDNELKAGLSALDICFSSSAIELLTTYIEEIEKWNKRYNLVKASGKTLIVKHLFDSLAGLHVFRETAKHGTILDIGSGAGFPGIPLSVFMTDSFFILSERSKKRAGFLHNVRLLLHLDNVEVFDDDYNHLNKNADIITFRAFSEIDKILDNLQKILHPWGKIIAYKGRRQKIQEELAGIDVQNLSIDIHRLNVPFLNEERHLVIMQRLVH